MNWQQVVRSILLRHVPDEYPFVAFEVRPPAGLPWPNGLPPSNGLQRFYSLCDGGNISQYNWAGISELQSLTERWVSSLRAYDDRGDVLSSSQHIAFATDASGCPVICDARSGSVSSFFFKGGDWEPLAPSVEDFLQYLFVSKPKPESWSEYVVFFQQRA